MHPQVSSAADKTRASKRGGVVSNTGTIRSSTVQTDGSMDVSATEDLEHSISLYLQRTCQTYDLTKNVEVITKYHST